MDCRAGWGRARYRPEVNVPRAALPHPSPTTPPPAVGALRVKSALMACPGDKSGCVRFVELGLRRALSPEILEPIHGHLGVTHRVLDILVAEVVLQGSGIVAVIGELVAAGNT